MLGDACFLARKDIALFLRSRETWLWTFLMPIVFFYFIGTVTGGFGRRGDTKTPIAVLVPSDAGFLAERLLRGLEARNYRVVRVASEAELAKHRRRLTIPPRFTESALGGTPVKVHLARTGDGQAADYDQALVARVVYTLLADVIAADKPAPESLDELARRPRNLTLQVTPAGKRRVAPSGFEQSVPGTMVMFTLLVLFISGGVTLAIERRQGILRRLASAPMSRGAVVLGKWGARMTLGLVQIVFALIAGTLLFRVQWGPHLPALVGLLAAYAGLATSLGILLGNFARSEGQVIGIGVIASNVLAALGGCWWPIEITPRWAQTLSLAFPTGWAMDALHKLVNFGEGPAVVWPHTAALAAAAIVAAWLVARSFRFQ